MKFILSYYMSNTCKNIFLYDNITGSSNFVTGEEFNSMYDNGERFSYISLGTKTELASKLALSGKINIYKDEIVSINLHYSQDEKCFRLSLEVYKLFNIFDDSSMYAEYVFRWGTGGSIVIPDYYAELLVLDKELRANEVKKILECSMFWYINKFNETRIVFGADKLVDIMSEFG